MSGDTVRRLGLPGLCNLHSHAFSAALAGMAEARGAGEDSFWTWRTAMYRFVDRLGPDELQAIAAQAYVEMLESGFTRVGEFHYLHHDPQGRPYAQPAELSRRIAAAAAETGIALTLLPVFYAHGGFGGAPAEPAQRRFLCDLESYARLLEGARLAVTETGWRGVGVAPHSLRAVTAAELRAVAALAEGGPVHIHIAEQEREVAECLAWSGRSPVAFLMDEAAVDGRWCLVHATHAAPAELERIAARGAVVGLCRSPRPIWATGSSRPRTSWPRAGGSAWARIPTC
jgi:formiminoglutamate deiminase